MALDGGNLPAGTTAWNNPDVVYWLQGPVTVPQGATLTIGPGQVIKPTGAPSSSGLIVKGTLVAQGTAAKPIVFTSPLDDTAGRRHQQRRHAEEHAPCPRLGPDPLHKHEHRQRLDHVSLRDGGDNVAGEVEADGGASPRISNIVVSNSDSYGLARPAAHAVVTGDTFQKPTAVRRRHRHGPRTADRS